MTSASRKKQRGNSGVEIAIVFVPMMFMMLSTMELGRSMWMYHTVTTAVKNGARFAMVHGADCLKASTDCSAKVSDIAAVVRRTGIGLDASKLQLTLTVKGSAYSCGSLTVCLTDTTQWPPSSGNQAGLPITVLGVYNFQSILFSLWPGQSSPSTTYSAAATEVIEF